MLNSFDNCTRITVVYILAFILNIVDLLEGDRSITSHQRKLISIEERKQWEKTR